ncbi:hypothetical protein ACMYQ1_19020 [Shewanella oncorhynchi]|uniref:hypothetical protein n=1 Tax=Shewanella oncorhynchi TaxID=2726434 RepID=UPI0039F0275B
MFKNLNKSDYLFDAKKNFFDLKIVQFFFFTITITSIICYVVILFNSKLHIDLSYVGFNNFVEIFKVPIAMLALNIPVIAVLGAFHKSEQTRLQIKLSDGQNLFANYFKHIEEFVKHIEKFEHKDERSKCDARRLHYKLYPNAVSGDYDISDEMAIKINELISYSKILLNGNDVEDEADIMQIMNRDFKLIFTNTFHLNYNDFYVDPAFFEYDSSASEQFYEILLNMANCFGYIVWYYDFIRHITSFNYSQKITKENYKILNSIRPQHYKFCFNQLFEKEGDDFRISNAYSTMGLLEIYRIFLFLFFDEIKSDSTR